MEYSFFTCSHYNIIAMRLLIMILLFSSTVNAQGFKSYIQYFTTGSYRNTEGDLIVKTNGQLYTVWGKFHNNLDDAAVADLAAKVSADSGRNWIDLGIIQQNIGLQTTTSVSLVRISSTVVHLYFCVKNSNTDLRIYRKISSDDCATWGAPVEVINDNGYMPALNNTVRKLASGRLIISIYFSANVGVIPPNYCMAYCWFSDNNGSTWTKSTPNLTRSIGVGYTEPTTVETSAGNLLMAIRNNSGFQHFSTSTNNGATWTTPVASTLITTDSPVKIIKLSTGKLIAIHNPSGTGMTDPRNVLRLSGSTDNGATWVTIMDLEGYTAGYNFSYSSAVEYNGNLLLTYWEANSAAGKLSQKFASIPITQL